MLSYASVKAPTIHSTLAGRCSNANTIIQNQIPASRIFSSSQNQQNNNKNIRYFFIKKEEFNYEIK